MDWYLCSQLARRLVRGSSAAQLASATEYSADLPPFLSSLEGFLTGEAGRQVVGNIGTETVAWREEAFSSITRCLQRSIFFL